EAEGRRSNPGVARSGVLPLDCFAPLAMTRTRSPGRAAAGAPLFAAFAGLSLLRALALGLLADLHAAQLVAGRRGECALGHVAAGLVIEEVVAVVGAHRSRRRRGNRRRGGHGDRGDAAVDANNVDPGTAAAIGVMAAP